MTNNKSFNFKILNDILMKDIYASVTIPPKLLYNPFQLKTRLTLGNKLFYKIYQKFLTRKKSKIKTLNKQG